ncbi:hypothetical protein Pint_17643 [Pistacia integerrima]|uniref:Uncharacterized protein n=1 Tax=Pistacia integerrima TaxID=434235 RepID=A0ACC0YZZ4_9ROSI|nr:hypothetical protein Pint_17643 [Pistacia integerrima]
MEDGEECRRCRELEVEIEKKRSEYKTMEAMIKKLEEKLKSLKRRKDGPDGNRKPSGIVDLTGEEEEDRVVELMIENSVLECEKKKAESEVEFLKQKLKEVEINVSEAVEDKPVNNSVSETPYNGTISEHVTCTKKEEGVLGLKSQVASGRRVRKHLVFDEGQSPGKKIAPSTPSVATTASLGIIDVCDSDEEPDMAHDGIISVDNHGNGNVCLPTDRVLEGIVGSEKETSKGSGKIALFRRCCEENTAKFEDDIPFVSTPKRKRASNVVTSDTESDDENDIPFSSNPKRKRASTVVTSDTESDDKDDNIPICKLRRMHLHEIISDQVPSEINSCSATTTASGADNIANSKTRARRRLVSLRKCLEKSRVAECSSSKTNETECQRGIHTAEVLEDDTSERDGSDTEGESLNGFIVESSEVSDDEDASSEAKDESDDNEDFHDILSRLKRSKGRKLEWEFEADMLAAFGKDPELCMKAVCALYRQQTNEEKAIKGSLVYNHRGFSKFDAARGTTLAEFLTEGNAQEDLKKSVKQLEEYDHKGVEMCRTFATRYSKQLFEIYKNKEDPLFSPS